MRVRRRRRLAFLVVGALLVLLGASVAGEHSHGGEGASAPERFRATTTHRFDDVEHWREVFDDPERNAWQKPKAVVRTLDLRPGMVVADVGAGTGYFEPYLSKSVGSKGTVFAVDVEPKLIIHLRDRAEKQELDNVVPVLASSDDPRLPAGSVDLVLIVDTFHHIDRRLGYFRRLKQDLAEEGRVAIIDWKKGDIPVGPPPDHRIGRDGIVHEMKAAGYRLAVEPKLLPYQCFLIFRPLAAASE